MLIYVGLWFLLGLISVAFSCLMEIWTSGLKGLKAQFLFNKKEFLTTNLILLCGGVASLLWLMLVVFVVFFCGRR